MTNKNRDQTLWPQNVNVYYGNNGYHSVKFADSIVSGNSPRVNGRLQLRPNTLNRQLGIRGYPSEVASNAYNDSRALNDAIAKFRDECYNGASAQMAVNLIQGKQALSMISESCDLLLVMAHTVATRNVKGLKKFFNRSNWRGISRNFGKAFLQLRYGWLPTMGDIYTAVNTLQDSYPTDFSVKVKSSKWIRGNYDISRSFATLTARVSVDSADLVKKHQLGLDNPAAIAWELVPYSFVLDWFAPIGLFLDGIPGYPGLTITGSSTTRGGVTVRCCRYYSNQDGTWHKDVHPSSSELWNARSGINYEDEGSYKWISRSLGISPPSFRMRTDGLSTGRALNSIAMLTQFLKSKR